MRGKFTAVVVLLAVFVGVHVDAADKNPEQMVKERLL